MCFQVVISRRVSYSILHRKNRTNGRKVVRVLSSFSTGSIAPPGLGEPKEDNTNNKGGHVLVMSNLYPQPNASAAGSRTSYVIGQLAKNKSVWHSVHFAASSKETDHEVVTGLQKEGVHFHSIEPNNTKAMKSLLDGIGTDLSLVIYDKFYTEEMFSFHIHNLRPDAVQVVDMQDMHSLRRGRQKMVEKNGPGPLKSKGGDADWECLKGSVAYTPRHTDELLLRELASLHRSDLSLVCSPTEQNLLIEKYKIPASKLCTASFWVDTSKPAHGNVALPPPWRQRNHFCFIGGFRHDPNVDAVKQLANNIWPCIRKQMPDAEIHIYGAHASHAIQSLHSPKCGFHIMGFTHDLEATLSQYRLLLAPLRYGAGIKGKIVDAWKCGLPVVTTPIGSEGMLGDHSNKECWGGSSNASTIFEFCDAAVKLHSDEDAWNAAAKRGAAILNELYCASSHWGAVAQSLEDAVKHRAQRRSVDYVRSVMWQESTRSTEYFSRWIETKNQKEEGC